MAFAKGNMCGNKKPKYENPEDMQRKIDQYFIDCEGTLLTDHNGDPIIDRWGNPVYLGKKPPTITGLALALGFKTRTGLNKYRAKADFMDMLAEARTRIEQYNEEQLFSRDGARGAMFNLRLNFAGWQEDKEDQNKGAAVSIINDIPKGTVTVNTDTAVFNKLQKPEESATQGEGKTEDG